MVDYILRPTGYNGISLRKYDDLSGGQLTQNTLRRTIHIWRLLGVRYFLYCDSLHLPGFTWSWDRCKREWMLHYCQLVGLTPDQPTIPLPVTEMPSLNPSQASFAHWTNVDGQPALGQWGGDVAEVAPE